MTTTQRPFYQDTLEAEILRLVEAGKELRRTLAAIASIQGEVEIGDPNTGYNASVRDMARAALSRVLLTPPNSAARNLLDERK